MAQSVQMPALGESVTEGTITRWLKQVGDRVDVDEPLVEVSTDKVDTEIPSPFAGVVERILVAEDETVPVGTELAVIGDGTPGEGAGDAGTSAAPAQSVVSEAAQEAVPDGPMHATPEQTTEPISAAEAVTDGEPLAEPSPPAASPDPTTDAGERTAQPAEPGGGRAPSTAGTSDGEAEIVMPQLGESVSEGTITRWLVQVGDTITVDQPIVEISTDKVDTEVPSPVAGVLSRILVGEDESAAVGAVLAVVGGEDADQPPTSQAAPSAVASSAPAPEPEVPAPGGPPPAGTAGPGETAASAETAGPGETAAPAETAGGPADDAAGGYVTPIVRKLAADMGVDLDDVTGTGVGGRIRRQDVQAAAEAARAARDQPAAEPLATTAPATTPPGVTPPRGRSEAMSRIRKTISRRMMESLHGSAQLTTVVEVDVTRIVRLRHRTKTAFEAREGVKLSFLPFFALAAVEALKAHPMINASTDGETITYHESANLGIAVDTERGLMVPVIREAGDLNLAGLARRIADLAERTRARKVGPDELSGGTFTLTNTGSRGALFDTPIINQPESAILGTGAVVKRPVVVETEGAESIAVRSMIYLALSYDHRIIDGADAARFLTTVKARLEEGVFEAELGL